MQFLVIAYDDVGATAALRRREGRSRHLDDMREIGADGQFISGGAILDEGGRTAGAAMIVDFPSRTALDAWLDAHPYVETGVWRDIRVHSFRVVEV